jgi:hypothetical protein
VSKQVLKPPEHIKGAERQLWPISSPDGSDRRYREKMFRQLPYRYHYKIANQYQSIYEKEGLRNANLYLLDLQDLFTPEIVELGTSTDAVNKFAEKMAKLCAVIRLKHEDPETAYNHLTGYLRDNGFTAPVVEKQTTLVGALNRMSDYQWWRRQIRKIYDRKFELGCIGAGFVHKHEGIYVSDETAQKHKWRSIKAQEYLESLQAVNELGESFSLAKLQSHSIANPVIRRHELVARCAGFEGLAQSLNHCALFITVTCPSRMHPRFAKSGDKNPKYDGTSPKDAESYLQEVWARIRSKLKRDGIHAYGIRIAEPQHDGTPHWHLMLFAPAQYQEFIKTTFTHYALQDSPGESGAKEHRCKIVEIDWSVGTATGYIVKYISKNIDGAYLDEDIHGNDPIEGAKRVRAWASVHGIRQFQQFGGVPVSLWREFRRLKTAPEGLMESARLMADSGDWKGFIEVLGGVLQNKKEIPVFLLKSWSDEPGRYGEPKGDKIIGVTDGVVELESRIHIWTLFQKQNNGAAEAKLQGAAL